MISPRSLQNYVMPYAMTALFDEKMLKVNQKNMDLKQTKIILLKLKLTVR